MPEGGKRLVIAIDGPVGAGKSTAARRLAQALGYVYIDSGAMYRAMGWKALQVGTDIRDRTAVTALAAVTDTGRQVTGAEPVAIRPGDPADLVAVRAGSLGEAIGRASQDRVVIRGGRVVARTSLEVVFPERVEAFA